MFRYVFLLFLFIGENSFSHQFTPTYPKFEYSFISGVLQTKMELFNKRKDVEYYELGVFDSEWNTLPFASENKIIKINYLETKTINVYIRNTDLNKVKFICTESKLKAIEITQTGISSKICSKVR